jgi:predicted DNA-binding transcriptional regulator AlpA
MKQESWSVEDERLVRPGEIARMLGIGRSTFFRFLKENKDFPASVRLGPRTRGWWWPEVRHWIESRRERNP